MNMDTRDVYDLFVDVVIHDYKTKDKKGESKVWVTSKDATWH